LIFDNNACFYKNAVCQIYVICNNYLFLPDYFYRSLQNLAECCFQYYYRRKFLYRRLILLFFHQLRLRLTGNKTLFKRQNSSSTTVVLETVMLEFATKLKYPSLTDKFEILKLTPFVLKFKFPSPLFFIIESVGERKLNALRFAVVVDSVTKSMPFATLILLFKVVVESTVLLEVTN
jgi:hypothetical protein